MTGHGEGTATGKQKNQNPVVSGKLVSLRVLIGQNCQESPFMRSDANSGLVKGQNRWKKRKFLNSLHHRLTQPKKLVEIN
jgi:hypothetical protein